MRPSIFVLLLLLIANATAAQRAYVTDRLEVQMRSGQSTQHKILKMVQSGTALTILDQDESTGYSLVALDSGEQGWILSRYITTQPVARAQIEDSQRKSSEVVDENKVLKTELATLRANKEALDKSSQDLNAETTRLNTELISIRQASANAIQIQAERDQLQEKVIDLQRSLDSLKREKNAQEADTRQNWFLIGASVLLGGILLGVLLPRISWRKRSSWDSF